MKRLTAFLLALAAVLGMLPFAGAAFKDEKLIDSAYKTAVTEMAAANIVNGFTDGSFGPKKTLTRAQAAKILCVLLEGTEKTDALTKTDTGFADVPESHWAAKFVAYCVDKGIVAGVGAGKFDPDAKLSAAAFAKMLLVAYGADSARFTGADWEKNVQDAVGGAYINNKVSTFNGRALPREEAAQMAWNAQFAHDADVAATKDMPSRPMPNGVPESLKLYAVGNSFSNNCMLGPLYEMLKDVGVKSVTLANLYKSGCPLQQHLKNAMSDEPVYTYWKRTDSDKEWVRKDDWSFNKAMADEDWDIISFQQTPSAGYQPAKNRVMYYMQKAHPTANFVWNIIWAHAKTSKQGAFLETWKGDQMAMYRGMVDLAKEHVLPDPRIRFAVPTGTAIQNARTSFLGDNLDRDGYHLNKGVGYYIAAMVWCCKLTGVTPERINYVPDDLVKIPPHGFDKNTPGLREALVAVAKESVANALANPYEITQSKLTTAP